MIYDPEKHRDPAFAEVGAQLQDSVQMFGRRRPESVNHEAKETM